MPSTIQEKKKKKGTLVPNLETYNLTLLNVLLSWIELKALDLIIYDLITN